MTPAIIVSAAYAIENLVSPFRSSVTDDIYSPAK
jgi:hypothetical protein